MLHLVVLGSGVRSAGFIPAVGCRVFEDFASGASILGITNALNEAGTLSFTGRAWSAPRVAR